MFRDCPSNLFSSKAERWRPRRLGCRTRKSEASNANANSYFKDIPSCERRSQVRPAEALQLLGDLAVPCASLTHMDTQKRREALESLNMSEFQPIRLVQYKYILTFQFRRGLPSRRSACLPSRDRAPRDILFLALFLSASYSLQKAGAAILDEILQPITRSRPACMVVSLFL